MTTEMSFREIPSTNSKNKNTTEPSLEELYTIDDLPLLKRAITELTAKCDHKTFNTQLCLNLNASKFNARSLNEDLP